MKIWLRIFLVLTLLSFKVDARLRQSLTPSKGALLKLLHTRLWTPTLYQEAPCSDGDIQSIDLDPSHPWRFSSPNFPSTKGYPHNVACNWKFKVKPEKVEKVSVICDHIDIAGNYYNDCKGGDSLTIRHGNDLNEVDAPGRLCGDLSDWVPLNATIHITYEDLDKQGVMARFRSNGRNTATGFSCRIFAHERKSGEIPSTTASTTTTTTTTTPEVCPDDDESYCRCGPVRQYPWNMQPRIPSPAMPQRIIGGGPTDPHEYPYQVALTYYDYFFCGGSLITRQHVLTAAHCTEYMLQLNDTENFKVIIAEHDLTNENDCAYAVGVEEIIAHPAYNNTSFDGDFSILVLEHRLNCTPFVSPVCLPNPRDEPEIYENVRAVAIGWGTVNVSTGEMPEKLQHVGVETLKNEDCGFYEYNMITENMICAGSEGKDSCYGDSGGPLLVEKDGRYVIAGVTSWGYDCGAQGYPGVYARVTAQLGWILETIGGEETLCEVDESDARCIQN